MRSPFNPANLAAEIKSYDPDLRVDRHTVQASPTAAYALLAQLKSQKARAEGIAQQQYEAKAQQNRTTAQLRWQATRGDPDESAAALALLRGKKGKRGCACEVMLRCVIPKLGGLDRGSIVEIVGPIPNEQLRPLESLVEGDPAAHFLCSGPR